MFEELLHGIGLSVNEAKVYEALLKLGEASVQGISLKSGVHRRNVYDSLAKLQEKSLAHESFIKGEKFFKPADPERLLEILKEKEVAVENKLPDLKGLFESKESEVEAYFHKGIEGFKSYLQAILDTKETVYFIGAKAFWLDPRLESYLWHFDKERKKRKIKFMHLFDHEIKTQKSEILKVVGKPYRFLPPKYSSSTAVDIFGPDSHFNIVNMGFTEPTIKGKIFPIKESPNEKARSPPPYPSSKYYDAKLWRFVKTHGSEDSLIWNIA